MYLFKHQNIFRNEIINLNKIEIPAVNGKMEKDSFMFSIEVCYEKWVYFT